jgi:hypothetical protein
MRKGNTYIFLLGMLCEFLKLFLTLTLTYLWLHLSFLLAINSEIDDSDEHGKVAGSLLAATHMHV